MHIDPEVSWKSLWTMLSSYQNLILNIENNFNNDYKWYSGILLLSTVCNIISWKGNHWMSSIIFFGQYVLLLWRYISFLFDGSLYLPSTFFVCCCVQVNFPLLKLRRMIHFLNIRLYIFPKNVYKRISFIIVIRWYKLCLQTITNGDDFQGIGSERFSL